MTQLINLTPHDVNICDEKGVYIRTIRQSGLTARVDTELTVIGEVDGIPLTQVVYKDKPYLPPPQPDTYFIVSSVLRNAATDRTDLLVPNQLVRDAYGNIQGCQSLGVDKCF